MNYVSAAHFSRTVIVLALFLQAIRKAMFYTKLLSFQSLSSSSSLCRVRE